MKDFSSPTRRRARPSYPSLSPLLPLTPLHPEPNPPPQKKKQTFPDRLRNRAIKLLASLYFRRAFLTLWRPVMLRHGIPLPGSPESVPRELAHVFNASPLLEWPRPLPPHVKLVGPILMDFSEGGEEGKGGEEEQKGVAAVASAAAAAAAAAAASSSSSSSRSSASSLDGRKDERAPLPPQVAALVDAAASGLSPPLVFVSFGTTVRLAADDARAVAAALRALAPAKVVWKLARGDLGGGLTPESLLEEVQGGGGGGSSGAGQEAGNIVAVPWLPQQALLSRRRRRAPSPPASASASPPPPAVAAFVTHGGMNGLYEAAASGVPLVGVPFFGDGEDNLEKAAGRGIGVTIGRGGLRQRKGEEGEGEGRWWRSKEKTGAAASAATAPPSPSSSSSSPSSFSSSPPPPSSPSSNLNASDPTTGAGRLALALRAVLDDPSFSREAARIARALRARARSTGRLPREEAADAVELGAWAWRSSLPSAALEGGRGGGEGDTCAAAATE